MKSILKVNVENVNLSYVKTEYLSVQQLFITSNITIMDMIQWDYDTFAYNLHDQSIYFLDMIK